MVSSGLLEPDRARLRRVVDEFALHGNLDARGLVIPSSFLRRIILAAPRVFDSPVLTRARFDEAIFDGAASFAGVIFDVGASFDGAQFRADTDFSNARFRLGAPSLFRGAVFDDRVSFDGAIFMGPAVFADTAFASSSSFAGGFFRDVASFRACSFRAVSFSSTHFGAKSCFDGAAFHDNSSFHHNRFDGDADFTSARFEATREFGPVLVRGQLILDATVFAEPVTLAVSALGVSCNAAQFRSGVRILLRWAEIALEEVEVGPAASIGFATPFDELDDGELQRFWPERGFQSGPKPRIISLRRTRVGTLALFDVDLTACRFAGAQNLDALRLEGGTSLARTPVGWTWRRPWPPRWRWTSRWTLAEEHEWRALRARASGDPGGKTLPGRNEAREDRSPRLLTSAPHGHLWQVTFNQATARARSEFPWAPHRPSAWHVGRTELPRWFDPQPSRPLDPRALALLYRALRKNFEDLKNDPGASDFYYGEMEMRRKAPETSAERLVLSLYWLLSGYGLRASRALTALLTTVLLFALLFDGWGFHESMHQGFSRALLFSAQSTTSLFRAPEAELSIAGEVFEMVLRLVGPLLFGLALFSLRGHIRR